MQPASRAAPILRRIAIGAAAALVVLLAAALLLLSFGWGLLRPTIERRLSAALDRPVTIARIRRVDGLSLHPLLAIEGVRVGQPPWAGRGDMLQVKTARVRIGLLPLLAGHVRPQLLLLDGMRLALVRGADGRANWEPARKRPSGGPSPDLGQVVVTDGVVSLDDRRYDRRLTARLTIDRAGLRLAGAGTIAGAHATLTAQGPAVAGGGRWPFRAEVTSSVVSARLRGVMATPLDLGHFTARAEGSGRDLRDLDRLIEAGLPATQPFRLSATVRHDRPAWIVTGLTGTIGRSGVAGDITVRKHDDRTLIEGRLRSAAFDFDDLSSDEGLAKAAADNRRTGPRVFPTLQIHLDKLRRTDGVLTVSVAHILSKTPTVFRSVSGTLTLDHGVLTASPLVAGMAAGTLTGSVVVRHPSGSPLLVADLRLRGSRLEAMFKTNNIISGPLEGRAVLRGHGMTVREAVGNGDGHVGIAARDGAITRRVALFLGSDVGHGLFAGNADRIPLTCLIGDFTIRGGVATPTPLVVDTPEARADGSGRITLADERVSLDLTGKPKRQSMLRLNGPIHAGGTLELPTINPPPQTKTAGGILKMIGKAIGGHPQPLGTDANCAALAAKALR